MLTQTPAAHHTHTPRPGDDHDAHRELIAQNLATDAPAPTTAIATGEAPRPRPKTPDMDLLRRCSATRYPARVQLSPRICRACHLQRTRQERQCDDLLGGQCRACHDPSL